MTFCLFETDPNQSLLKLAATAQFKTLSKRLQKMVERRQCITLPKAGLKRTICHALAATQPKNISSASELTYICDLLFEVYCNGQPGSKKNQQVSSFYPMTYCDTEKEIEPPITIAVRAGNIGMIKGLLPAYYYKELPEHLVLLALEHNQADALDLLLNFSREKRNTQTLPPCEQLCNFLNGLGRTRRVAALTLALQSGNEKMLNTVLDLLNLAFDSHQCLPANFMDIAKHPSSDISSFSPLLKKKFELFTQRLPQEANITLEAHCFPPQLQAASPMRSH